VVDVGDNGDVSMFWFMARRRMGFGKEANVRVKSPLARRNLRGFSSRDEPDGQVFQVTDTPLQPAGARCLSRAFARGKRSARRAGG